MVNLIALRRRLQKVSRMIVFSRQLMCFSPISDLLEIATCVDGVEVDEGLRSFSWWLVPDLAKHTDIDSAHQLLAEYIEAVSDVIFKDTGVV